MKKRNNGLTRGARLAREKAAAAEAAAAEAERRAELARALAEMRAARGAGEMMRSAAMALRRLYMMRNAADSTVRDAR